MKVTNYATVADEAATQLGEAEWLVLDYLNIDQATNAVTNIYMNSDMNIGHGQDFDIGLSIISSRERISVIADGTSSFYKHDGEICSYDDLADDIAEILLTLDAALQRLQTFL